ncbi:MAG: hypothetical protein PHQ40_20930 [Anaerolineaceae bacterium]|nr:hypothetical protein [Anaerolineaceae bacterium]
MDRYFDFIYYASGALILGALGYSIFAGLNLYSLSPLPIFRKRGLAVLLLAIGMIIVVIAGFVGNALLKGSIYYQQITFACYYIGFALITFALNAMVGVTQETNPLPKYLSNVRVTSLVVWALFLGTLVVSGFYLFNPKSFVFNQYGVQIQRVVYWMPMFTTTFAGAILSYLLASQIKEKGEKKYLFWICACFILLLIGMLGEWSTLPDWGNPITNLLVIFVPFVLACLCLCFGVRVLLKKVVKNNPSERLT